MIRFLVILITGPLYFFSSSFLKGAMASVIIPVATLGGIYYTVFEANSSLFWRSGEELFLWAALYWFVCVAINLTLHYEASQRRRRSNPDPVKMKNEWPARTEIPNTGKYFSRYPV